MTTGTQGLTVPKGCAPQVMTLEAGGRRPKSRHSRECFTSLLVSLLCTQIFRHSYGNVDCRGKFRNGFEAETSARCSLMYSPILLSTGAGPRQAQPARSPSRSDRKRRSLSPRTPRGMKCGRSRLHAMLASGSGGASLVPLTSPLRALCPPCASTPTRVPEECRVPCCPPSMNQTPLRPLPPAPSRACTSADIKEALEALATIDEVSVAFATGMSVCQEDGSEVVFITFITQHGDVPLLIADDSLLVDDTNGGVRSWVLLDVCAAMSFPVACHAFRGND